MKPSPKFKKYFQPALRVFAVSFFLFVTFGYSACSQQFKSMTGVDSIQSSAGTQLEDYQWDVEDTDGQPKTNTTPTPKPSPTPPSTSPHSCVKQPTNNNKECYLETFQQPGVDIGAIDILFVVDTSGSINAERQAIVNGIGNFISALPANSDINIAVMLGHGSTSTWSGKLYKAGSEPVVLKSSALSIAQIRTHFATKMNTIVEDLDSDGGEEGVFSLFRGITTPALLTASQAAGIFRPTAALSVVFVSDENDICAVYPVGVTPVNDPDGREATARIRDCEGITIQGLNNQLSLLKATKPYSVSGIIYSDMPVPVDGENEVGYGYSDLINLTGGVTIDMANDNIATELASIGELNGLQMSNGNTFTLAHSGADSASLVVKVNGQTVPYTFQNNKVTITQSIPAGATITIYYCIKSTSNGSCHNSHHRRHHKWPKAPHGYHDHKCEKTCPKYKK